MIKRAALAAAGLLVGIGVAAGVSQAAIGPVSRLTTAHVANVEPVPSPTVVATATPAPQTSPAPAPAPAPEEAPSADAPAEEAPTAEPEPSTEPEAAPSPEPTTEPKQEAPAPEPEAPPAPETPDTGGSSAGSQDAFDQQMVALINAERKAAGVAPLQYWGGLRSGALRHSTWMDGNDFQHASDATIGADSAAAGCSRGWAENIYWASDTGTSPEAAMRSYMDSPGHRANILSPELRYVATGTVATDGGLFNTQRFGHTCG